MNQIEIFKVGPQTSNSGATTEFTADTLRAAASTYNAKIAEGGDTFKAPLVIGHPTDTAPAYGWIDSLAYDEASGTLLATPSQVNEGLKTLVAAGAYKKVSASFYTPESPANPAKEGFFLRHLGFLGAMAPAVKGLQAVSFSDAADGVVSFGDAEDEAVVGTLQKIMELVKGALGLVKADVAEDAAEPVIEPVAGAIKFNEAAELVVVAEPVVAAEPIGEAAVVAPAAVGTPTETPGASFAEAPAEPAVMSEPTPVVQVATARPAADFAEAEARIASKEAELASREAAVKTLEIESFCEGLITSGRLLPVAKTTVTTLLQTLGNPGSVEFAEGSKTAADMLKEFLSSLPKMVEFSEVAAEQKALPVAKLDFAVAEGHTVNPEQLEQYMKARSFMHANPGTSIANAYKNI